MAEVPVKEAVFGRLIVGTHDGADFVYMQGAESLFRYRWDGESLTFDDAWGSVSVLADGQIAAASPNVGTDWVFFQTNGAPSEVPMSVWAVSTHESSVRHTIQPFADLSFDKSFNFSMGTYDPVNSRVYIADACAGYLAGLSFDPNTGFDRLWQEDQTTFGYTMIVGPPEERVFVATNVIGAGSRVNPLLARREEVLFVMLTTVHFSLKPNA
ncbi:hypothetical protein [Pseudooctadecabacter jejudonensis]|uniref:SMP-30/Gluconolaconase/LRE-like region n=1 Tax=Pseudooctadecabacter jejudonensis TaxID=1391910 RepID=A0A1Y5T9C2_9RHOB|nr:hypothetical protein [Pseudooctadecabacter jejudonensis]SLN56817.1 hypothetical protein PSJ8397_03021 [Pseudooctadecabacter jejudonensis]